MRIMLLQIQAPSTPPMQPASLRRLNDRLACHHTIRDHDFVVFLGLNHGVAECQIFNRAGLHTRRNGQLHGVSDLERSIQEQRQPGNQIAQCILRRQPHQDRRNTGPSE